MLQKYIKTARIQNYILKGPRYYPNFAHKIHYMSPAQMIILIFFPAFAGWLISWISIRFLFTPALQHRFASKIGKAARQDFLNYKGVDEKIADPGLLEKLKPAIEQHVDLFLNEKLSTVFPLLSKLMGEKTLMQFKNAFLAEIDILFPVVINSYAGEFKKTLDLEKIISEKITAIPIETIRKAFYKNAQKEIIYFKAICISIGLLCGILGVISSRLIQ